MKKKALELSPVDIVKASDESLSRAALTGVSLVNERRELEANGQADFERHDFSASWLDPTAKDIRPCLCARS